MVELVDAPHSKCGSARSVGSSPTGGTIVGVGSTGGAGQWCTPALIPPGTYTVTETPQAGWTNTDPGGSTPVKTVVVGSNAAPTVWFDNRQP